MSHARTVRRALGIMLILVAVSSVAGAAAPDGPLPEAPITNAPGEAREATINLQVARGVRDLLTDQGIVVSMTRNSDRTLEPADRTGLANRKQVDAFISIHHNASTVRSANGAIVFRSIRADGSWRLGRSIADGFSERAAGTRPVRLTTRRGCCGDYYYQLRLTRMPAVLVEGAFVSNPTEGRRLADDPTFRAEIAGAIADGIVAYQRTLTGAPLTERNRGTVIEGSHVPVADARGSAPGATRVRLRFTAPDQANARYRIYRDGVLIAQIARAPGSRAAYTDRTVAPGQTYAYQIRTTEQMPGELDVWRESVATPVQVTTPAMSVVLDPGHGGRDPGALYRY